MDTIYKNNSINLQDLTFVHLYTSLTLFGG